MAVRLRCWRFNSCFPVFIILYCCLLITAERDSSLEYSVISHNPSFNSHFGEISFRPLRHGGSLHRFKRATAGSSASSTNNATESSNSSSSNTNGTDTPSITTVLPSSDISTPIAATSHHGATAVPNPGVSGGNNGGATSTLRPLQASSMPPVEIYDNHKYYSSKIIYEQSEFQKYWKDMSIVDAKIHDLLSDHYRLASTEKLKFPFRFYGHSIDNVTIATGGFLYMSPFLHRFLTATQYIAPLMANFDTRVGNESHIIFHSDNDQFTVHWQRVHLKDQYQAGHFSFQVTLYKDHRIAFGYQKLAMGINKIDRKNHPVKVGLSDAYYIDKDIPELKLRRRTIYEYHKVSVKENIIHEGSIVLFTPYATCNTADTCDACTQLQSTFNCRWCGTLQRCSDGIDWYRQKWLDGECKKYSGRVCHNIPMPHQHETEPESTEPESNVNTGVAVAVILVLLAILLGVGGFIAYAYTHPTSSSGIWLMEHRPSVMRSKLAKIKFWKTSDTGGDKYSVEAEA